MVISKNLTIHCFGKSGAKQTLLYYVAGIINWYNFWKATYQKLLKYICLFSGNRKPNSNRLKQ